MSDPMSVPRWVRARAFAICVLSGCASGVMGLVVGIGPTAQDLRSIIGREALQVVQIGGTMGLVPGLLVGVFAQDWMAARKRVRTPRRALLASALLAFPLPFCFGIVIAASAGC